MISSSVRTTDWKIWLIIGVISITGGAVSEKEADITLTPSYSEVERYVSTSHFVSCKSTRGLHMIWTRDSTDQITANKGRIHIEEAPKGLGVALVFESIESKDKGNYTCTATVDDKQVQASFKLIVIKPIKFLDTSTEQTATENQNVLVPCEVDGDPQPTIMWTVRGKTPQGPKYRVVADGLIIDNVTLEDKGEYNCRAFQWSSVQSNMLDRTIILKIEHKPVWRGKNGSEKAYGYMTGTVNLTCEVSAEPKPKFEWLRANRNITSQQNVTIFEEEFRSTLQLQVSSDNVFGNYVCKASNTQGKMEKVFLLLEVPKPEVPEMSVHETTPDSVMIAIEGPENDDEVAILAYRVKYLRKKDLHKGWETAQEVEFLKGKSPYTLSGLIQDTNYVVRVAARNAAGFGDYTEERSFTTDPATTSTTAYLSSKASRLIAIITLHNIISITVDNL